MTLTAQDPPPRERPIDRSPIALALSPDGTRLLTANQTSGSVSLLDPKSGQVLDEILTGERPAGVAFAPDGRSAAVTHWYGYDLALLRISDSSHLEIAGRVRVGPEPRGVVIAPDGASAYVAVGVANEVVRLSLPDLAITGRLTVGREPRHLALTPDGSRLLVANSRSSSLSVIDTAAWSVAPTLSIQGTNLRQLAIGPDGLGYVAHMRNRGFATTDANIDLGWVLGQRISRVDLAGESPFQTLTLDPRGQAAGDAIGLAINPSGSLLAVALGGTHEVMLFRTNANRPLPWRTNGSRDLMDAALVSDSSRFRRVPLGGRPTEIAFAPDGHTLYVANYLENAVQVVDAESATLTRTIPLGPSPAPTLARRGEAIFHDATRSSNQWFSCNTCHSDGGHTNGNDFDTSNDGWQDLSTSHTRSRKKVPTLRRVTHTGPWTWHGWQSSLDASMFESFTKSMQGPDPSPDDVQAIVAYLGTLEFPPNPYRASDGSITESARRGQTLFNSSRLNCASCHSGPELTDGKIHDVGLGERGDRYDGHNPPSLVGTYDKDPYLHDGRAATLRDMLTSDHGPESLNNTTLTDSELDDLIAYLQSL
jgi:YVTN family beta-propeller protein